VRATSGPEDTRNVVGRTTIGCAGGQRRDPHLLIGEAMSGDNRGIAMPPADFIQLLEIDQFEINDYGVGLLALETLLPQLVQAAYDSDFPEVCA
jgi:hypothetical protein